MTPEARKKYALKVVNRVRKQMGLNATSRLTKGVPGHTRACTVTMSLAKTPIDEVNYGDDNLVVFSRWEDHPVTVLQFEDSELAAFLRAFDAGEYPELEIPLSEVKINGQALT